MHVYYVRCNDISLQHSIWNNNVDQPSELLTVGLSALLHAA